MRSRTTRKPTVYDWLFPIPPISPKPRRWAWPSVPKPAAATGVCRSHAGRCIFFFLFLAESWCLYKVLIKFFPEVWCLVVRLVLHGAFACSCFCSAVRCGHLQRQDLTLKKTDLSFTGLPSVSCSFPPYSPELSSMIIKTGNASGCRSTGTLQECAA